MNVGERHVEDLDTAHLVSRFQAGEREAFTAIYTRYFDRVYAYLRVALNDPHEAEDLTHQVFMKALEALPSYEHRGKPLRAWLFTIVRNEAIKHLEKHNRIDPEDPTQVEQRRQNGSPEPDLNALAWLTDTDLLTFIERLPLPQRQVVLMRYMLELPNTEIATILNRPPADIRLLHHRAMRFLKKRLISIGREPGTTKPVRWQRTPKHANVLRSRRFALD